MHATGDGPGMERPQGRTGAQYPHGIGRTRLAGKFEGSGLGDPSAVGSGMGTYDARRPSLGSAVAVPGVVACTAYHANGSCLPT